MAKKEVYNFEISDESFDQLVLINSHKLPVFVLFYSPVSSVCIDMESRLIGYAKDFAGQFILARLDIDMYPDARERLDVQNIPLLRIYKDGEMVHQEMGVITDEEMASAFRKFDIFNPAEDLRLQAAEQHAAGNTPEAVQLLTQAIQLDPSNTKVAMDMCQIFLDVNMLAEAAELYTKLPQKIIETDTGRYLIGQITFKKLALDTEGLTNLQQKVLADPGNEEVLFDLAVCQIADQNYDDGMEQLFTMLRNNPNAKGGGARELAIATINMLELKDPEYANKFRRTLSSTVA